MKKTIKTRRGWGLLINDKVLEVVICKRKPHHDNFFDGEYHSKIKAKNGSKIKLKNFPMIYKITKKYYWSKDFVTGKITKTKRYLSNYSHNRCKYWDDCAYRTSKSVCDWEIQDYCGKYRER